MTAELPLSPRFAHTAWAVWWPSLRGVSTREYHESLWEGVPEGLWPPYWAARLAFLLAHVPAGARVLDVGCGEGWFTAALARAGREAVGIDVARGAAAPRARTRGRAELDCASSPRRAPWPLQDVSFDAVWAGEVLEHVADTAGWLSEVRRVLRSGGALVLSTPAHGPLTRLRAGPLGARVRGPLRPPLRPPALLHPPHAGRAAGGFRLRADRDPRLGGSIGPCPGGAAGGGAARRY